MSDPVPSGGVIASGNLKYFKLSLSTWPSQRRMLRKACAETICVIPLGINVIRGEVPPRGGEGIRRQFLLAENV
jgi:hypothetical protein